MKSPSKIIRALEQGQEIRAQRAEIINPKNMKPAIEPGWVIITPEKHKEFEPKQPGEEFWDNLGMNWYQSVAENYDPIITYRRRIASTTQQPAPIGTGQDITSLVIADIEARAKMGEKKYGSRLTAHNGRNAMTDAYQEVLDLAVYFRQLIYERDNPKLIIKFRNVVRRDVEMKNAGIKNKGGK